MIQIAIFASGEGTNALTLLEETRTLKNIAIPLLIMDRNDSSLPEKVRSRFPKTVVKFIPSPGKRVDHENLILQELKAYDIQWIFLAGYMRIIGSTLLKAFEGTNGHTRIVNIHPSLLPAYPGVDSFRRVFDAGEKISGITLHLVDAGTDTGPILLQRAFERYPHDDFESFHQRGKEIEWKIYPELLRKLDQEGTLMPMSPPLFQTLIALPTRGEHQFNLFWIRYTGAEIQPTDLLKLAPLISDEIDQTLLVNPDAKTWTSLVAQSSRQRLQVIHFRPGVTDNPAHSFKELLAFTPLFQGRSLTVHSGEAILLGPDSALAPFNRLIHESRVFSEFNSEFSTSLRDLHFPESQAVDQKITHFELAGKSGEELEKLSVQQFWALSRDEMQVIQAHYAGLGNRAPTDVEMEVLAQTWSEHCKHKIFAATIDYEDSKEKFQVQGLFKTYIAKPTEDLRATKPWAISVFKDNAGIVRFDEDVDLCIKVETHNSPSALDPYGGALTGILGVNRDIMGTGLGARPIANTNVLLFGEPTETHELPKGLLHPREILKGVHKGIQDGGNKSGIPTVNGAMLFDESFSGKPLVYCGTIGVLPREINGVPSASKNQKPGDLIVMVGGAVGADGLHGATSSSLAFDQTTPSSMVQIGDPLTQKRMLDFILEARDLGLYSSITDNGAGGLSSSIGEMAEQTNGAEVWLDRVPLKYPGLLPWQIFTSESQERMTLSVPKNKIESLVALAKSRGVEATVVGEFTASGALEIKYGSSTVGNLSLAFLHNGLPKMKLKARWNGLPPKEHERPTWKSQPKKRAPLSTIQKSLETLLADPSIASKENWIRQYDHEVQAATAIKPFEGVPLPLGHSAPNDGGLIWLGAHGNRGFSGVGVASGICPDFSLFDAGLMAKLAADEAVRNLIVMGIDPNRIALIDNFCWPDPLPGPKNPDAEHKLAQLVRTCRSLSEVVYAYGMPLISGKDSMKNDFIGTFADGKSVKISVLPTLLVTAMGHHPDVRTAVKAHAKPGSILYLLGQADYEQYFGMTLSKHFEINTELELRNWDLATTRALYSTFFTATQKGMIQSAHDLSEGGLMVALFETLLLNQGGISLDLPTSNAIPFLFNENPGRFLVSIAEKDCANFESTFSAQERIRLGTVDSSARIEVLGETLTLASLESIWKGAL